MVGRIGTVKLLVVAKRSLRRSLARHRSQLGKDPLQVEAARLNLRTRYSRLSAMKAAMRKS
jgi:hypothetical protein